MQDQLLTCQNCGNPFVYSVYEQIADQKKAAIKSQISSDTGTTEPLKPHFCPICTAIKQSEIKHPPKPKA